MNKNDSKALLVESIEDMKDGQFEEMFLVSFYSLSSYFKSLFTFGFNSDITKDNLNIIKEMFNILRTERILFNFIIKNIDKFNLDSAQDVVDSMDELNDKTVLYYYHVIDDILDAVLMKEERRGIRPKKNFPTLIQTDSYTNQVLALAENRDNLKEFLGFEEEFWSYIKDIEYSIEVPLNIAEEMTYVTAILDENRNVAGIKMLIPEVIDLGTALLAIKLYHRAYDLYKMIGKEYDNQQNYEYIESQDRYQNRYLLRKSQSLLS